MRGEDAGGNAPSVLGLWITPACAGKTFCLSYMSVFLLGSPPHARGRPRPVVHSRSADGITPACAGKTTRPLL